MARIRRSLYRGFIGKVDALFAFPYTRLSHPARALFRLRLGQCK